MVLGDAARSVQVGVRPVVQDLGQSRRRVGQVPRRRDAHRLAQTVFAPIVLLPDDRAFQPLFAFALSLKSNNTEPETGNGPCQVECPQGEPCFFNGSKWIKNNAAIRGQQPFTAGSM